MGWLRNRSHDLVVGSLERLSTLLYQKKFSWSLGVELTATGERQATASGNGKNTFGPRQTYFIGALPLYGQFDTSDDLLNPTKGYRLSARVSPETSRTNKDQSFYVRAQGDASYYQSISEKIVLALCLQRNDPNTPSAQRSSARRPTPGTAATVAFPRWQPPAAASRAE